MSVRFDNLGLSENLQRTVTKNGYSEPTPVQAQAIPIIQQGKDLLAAAQTGTGKTAAFVLPLLNEIEKDPTDYQPCSPRVLILTPTRELAAQVAENIEMLKGDLPVRVALAYGGVGINPQKKALAKGTDFLVATPGRLLDLIRQRMARLSSTHTLVLDEADRMLDMGFLPDLKRIMKFLPEDRQTLLFSATFSPEIKKLSLQFLNNPESVEVSRNKTAELVRQTFYKVPKTAKADVIRDLIVDNQWNQTLIFTRTKYGADKLCKQLLRDGFKAKAIHGDKSQNHRSTALEEFKKGELPILVATDVAARGLDIEKLPQVVNYELPEQAEDYVHRIGRVGRAGLEGEAYSLVSSEELPRFKAIEKFLKTSLRATEFPGLNYENYKESSGSSSEGASRRKSAPRTGKSAPRNAKNRDSTSKMDKIKNKTPRGSRRRASGKTSETRKQNETTRIK